MGGYNSSVAKRGVESAVRIVTGQFEVEVSTIPRTNAHGDDPPEAVDDHARHRIVPGRAVAADVGSHYSAIAKGSIERAVGVAAHQSEGVVHSGGTNKCTRCTRRDDPSEAIHGNRSRPLGEAIAVADVGNSNNPVGTTKGIVERAVRIVPC